MKKKQYLYVIGAILFIIGLVLPLFVKSNWAGTASKIITAIGLIIIISTAFMKGSLLHDK